MIKIENLCVSYGKKVVYDGFNLTVDDGKVTCILGESGSGKTTLLNAIASLIPYSGSISKVVSSYVFQEPRLVPNLTVKQNLKLVSGDDKKIDEMLAGVGLTDKSESYPKSLSGGEAQRIAVLRSFIYPSDAILLDEPFSSLDLKVKLGVMQLFQKLSETEKRTALFITHDVDEAVFLADRIIIINDGRIVCDFENADKGACFGANTATREKLFKIMLGGELSKE